MGSDNSVYVPITTVMYRLNPERTTTGEHVVNTIYMQAVDTNRNDLAIEQVTELLRERHGIGFGEDETCTSTVTTAVPSAR